MTNMNWLPSPQDWRQTFDSVKNISDANWHDLQSLAATNLNFTQTNALDQKLQAANKRLRASQLQGKPIKLAILSTSTTSHLHPGIRIAGFRRGIDIEIYQCAYGQYWQELADRNSELHKFCPNTVLFYLDGYHVTLGIDVSMQAADVDAELESLSRRIEQCWILVNEHFQCPIIHQACLPVHQTLMGNNERRLPGSPAGFLLRTNEGLRSMADTMGVDILALDDWAGRLGLSAWHDAALWHRSKQEISPKAAPLFGELCGRLLGARQGRSAKALVLDLDNTIWGGVVGDDGVQGLVLGQGSAQGEAYVAFQEFAKQLSKRGIILAVCSKNDEINALDPFDNHPEMVLKRSDIASFVANWQDKATNIRDIARTLNIGLDAIVFVDDNPFERSLIRRELPEVNVPEVGDDPATYAQMIADAGYFESIAFTDEDRLRTSQYQENIARTSLQGSSIDLSSYLESLDMRLEWAEFDLNNLNRIVQLVNKTNQFNLTTKRYSSKEIIGMIDSEDIYGVYLRLVDKFGDNGIIAVVVAEKRASDFYIDSWLMSCRVLGRQVEDATLRIIVELARRVGATRLIGEYQETKKNQMVKGLYAQLGFSVILSDPDVPTRYKLTLSEANVRETPIDIVKKGI